MLPQRSQFPVLQKYPNLAYLDSAATALRPAVVIAKEMEYYREYSANIHRGVYQLSERATEEYEAARRKIAQFLGLVEGREKEIIFTRNATESVNLVAYAYARHTLKPGDEIALTIMEHHANLVPWQQAASETGAILRYLEINAAGQLETSEKSLEQWITKKTKIAALAHGSNVLGTINDLVKINRTIRQLNSRVIIVVDGAQTIPRLPVSITDIDCDFFVASGHKAYGPSGIGILWGRYELLENMSPFETGGGMIREVGRETSTFEKPPEKFEAGTPDIAGAIGLGKAVEFLTETDMNQVRRHEVMLNAYALKKLNSVEGVSIVGPKSPEERTGIFAFTVKGVHPHDLAQLLDQGNVAVRAGHHCAMPLHTRLELTATTRASFGVYTTEADIDKLVEGIEKAKQILQ
jgi:cysteine desulfurase/selenocysteine lyase